MCPNIVCSIDIDFLKADDGANFHTVSPPTIKFHPDNITTAFGGNLSITCIADGYGPLTYTWEKKGIGVLQKSSSPRLALSNVSESMEGLYRCRVVNEHQGRVLSEYARVKGQPMYPLLGNSCVYFA